MSMTIHSSIKGKILEAQNEASKDLNAPAERLRGLDKQMERKGNGGLYFVGRIWVPFDHWHYVTEGGLHGFVHELLANFLKIVQETTDKIFQIKERPKTTGDRQKSYADNRRKPLEFSIGDQVLLKVSPWKGVVRFGKRGKLAPRFVGPFEIVERIGPVAYRLRLPQELRNIHDTFYVTNLKKCLVDTDLHVPLDELKIDDKLHFVEEPLEIMDHKVKRLKQSRVPIVKVRWNSRRGPEFTWEREDEIKGKYPHLFVNASPLEKPT
ncbi:hypothetical protein Tco_0635244 [Tanacetum coccineum]